ncbi:aminotransferase class I/II-fold pyridoxal phosphate-dependent enzyme [Nonlabens sp. Ci31]|jgi:aspartate/methionine/tyrosine aminotransferase|uniref:pyridoxal phosphate-dependent aminotransferase n=1 Tax=Nonlabens sp. Ci31 TaxID=2608253 RepID=UPI00146322E7|nr:aminotransferase class I/II-fold pyridoxal phosphate-dependent enzyme [Nonlabens sp. Ci31]QJP33425.1 aminotransferase class I/II-fold pyridoxal phosphate-dependent enzyme [Nonlabens sp. Ci31]
MIQAAKRLDSVQEYYFATKLREVRSLILLGKPIINAGIGNPDLLPPEHVVPALTAALQDTSAHGYQSYLGLPELRTAMAGFYKKQYQVVLDSDSEIIPLMGSKEGILHASMAFLNPGDEVLIPDPGYPTYASATKLCEATAVSYDLTADHNWMPDFDALEKLDLSKVKIMWTNYPHMPSGAPGSLEFFERLIAFAKKNEILIINDNPYSCLYPDKISIHQVAGSMEVALELNSISKTYNMAGWRVGMLSGKAEVLKEVLKVKTNMDSGMFYGVQKGAIAALETDNSWLENQNKMYKKRLVLTVELAMSLNLQPQEQSGGLFVWCKLPEGEKDDKAFVDHLLYENGIFIAPGSIFGSNGIGYVRFSLCVKEEQIKEMIERVSKKIEA